jgi:hypothetical protein
VLLGPDKDPKAGMKLQTRIVKSLVGATIVAVFFCAGAGTALAGTLLSGYGGPGEGNQALLGAGLVNLPSGGGTGGGSGAVGSPSGAAPSQAPSSGSSSPTTAGGKGKHRKGTGSATGGKPSRTPGAVAGGYRAAHTPAGAAEPVPGGSAGSQPLGLSGSDVLYILLALAALAVTALVTRQLTHAAGRGARG